MKMDPDDQLRNYQLPRIEAGSNWSALQGLDNTALEIRSKAWPRSVKLLIAHDRTNRYKQANGNYKAISLTGPSTTHRHLGWMR